MAGMDDVYADPAWFDDRLEIIEKAYLGQTEPWKGSGFSGPRERWNELRMPVADAITTSGLFLDIGCANGFLLECVAGWTGARGLTVEPFGLDLSAALVALARARFPGKEDHFFVGNALTWQPLRRFQYVRTETVYVPRDTRVYYLGRALEQFVAPGGALLVAEYRYKGSPHPTLNIDAELRDLGFKVEKTLVAMDSKSGTEGTKVAVIRKPA